MFECLLLNVLWIHAIDITANPDAWQDWLARFVKWCNHVDTESAVPWNAAELSIDYGAGLAGATGLA
jgi:hypothetical protein